MSIASIYAEAAAARNRPPEGITVTVVAPATRAQAVAIGPDLARRIYRDRDFGRVLDVAEDESTPGQWLVSVEDLGVKAQRPAGKAW